MLNSKSLKQIKTVVAAVLLLLMLIFLIWVNVSEIKKGNATNRTVAGSTFRNVTYFNDFSLKTFEGDDFSNKDFEGYDVIVVNVWEPWCTSCLKEMPELDEIAAEYKDKGLLLVELQGMAYDDPDDVQLGYDEIGDLEVTLTQLLADEKFSEEVLPYLNNSFPGTFVLDPDGNILDFTASSKSKADWMKYFDGFLPQE